GASAAGAVHGRPAGRVELVAVEDEPGAGRARATRNQRHGRARPRRQAGGGPLGPWGGASAIASISPARSRSAGSADSTASRLAGGRSGIGERTRRSLTWWQRGAAGSPAPGRRCVE